MKKLFSSVFIVLVLLNVMGYYGILMGLKHSNEQALRKQFDAGLYDIDETQVIKIPFKTPYDADGYTRVDGDFVRDGEVYRLIKQRQYRDTFHIVYMKDKTGTIINKAISDYVKTFSDSSAADNSGDFLLPVLLKEYFSIPFNIKHLALGWEQTMPCASSQKILIHSYLSSIVHPPERVV